MRFLNAMSAPLCCAVALTLTLPACTSKGTTKATTDPTTDILSSTSGKSWFSEDGLVKDEFKVEAFTALNFDNVQQDMAQGRGEYLASLGTLLGVSQERQADFFRLSRERYPLLMNSGRTTPAELIAGLHGELTTDLPLPVHRAKP